MRVIPVLLLRRKGLVKTVRFRRPEYVGDPINIVRIFNEKEADEVILTELQATRDGRRPDFSLIEEIASEAFMPLCYGGGITSVEDAKAILRLGVEKVSLNSALFDDPALVNDLAGELGSQCVVASVDVKRGRLGGYQVHSHAGRPVREKDPSRWIAELIRRGAGEILLNSVDRDGTLGGYDLELLRAVRGRFDVPIIACGGASGLADMTSAIRTGGPTALGVGARFIYEGPYRAVLVSYLSRNELRSLSGEAVQS